MVNTSDTENIIEACLAETEAASRSKYDAEKADKTAALFLTAQMKLSFAIEDAELKAKNLKNEIQRMEGEKYFEYKTNNTEKKITENMIVNYVAKDKDIVSVKFECAKQESSLKKMIFIFNILKDGHIYFRNLGKNKVWSE